MIQHMWSMVKMLISFPLLTFAVQLDYTTHLFVDIFLNPAIPVLLSGIMPVMDFSSEEWGFEMKSFCFCRNLGLALDSCAVVRLGSVIISLLES